MYNVYLAQVNYSYGGQYFLPYSAGLIQAYAQSFADIKEYFYFNPPLYKREDIDTFWDLRTKPDILGVSCYIWNWEYNKLLMQKTKELFPNCLIVCGGPQIPKKSEDFFDKHPYVDTIIHNEGEEAFVELLSHYGYGNVPKEYFGERIQDLDKLVSPYLAGVFDSLLKRDVVWQASQETNRGCPYRCTFCDWGSATMTKVRRFSCERIVDEMAWMSDNKIEMLYNCDANYGLFPEDEYYIDELCRKNENYGYPKLFRAAYAKKTNGRVYDINSKLAQHGMSKGATLSVQSMDDGVLQSIKRLNIKFEDMEYWIGKYNAENIPTYTEIIYPLPDESIDTFMSGFDKLLNIGQHDGIFVYNCMVLENSELNDEDYIEKYGIKYVNTVMPLTHGTKDAIPERYNIVYETNTMSYGMWLKSSLYAYIIQGFHCMGLTQELAKDVVAETGIGYGQFYKEMLDFFMHGNYFVSEALRKRLSKLVNVVEADEQLGYTDGALDIVYPEEEGLFLDMFYNLSEFYSDMGEFLQDRFPGEQFALDFLNRQHSIMDSLHQEYSSREDFERYYVWYGRKGVRKQQSEITNDLSK